MNKQYIISCITLAFFIACFLSLSQAIPITDVSSTSVVKTKDTAGRLVLSVKRVDDLIDDNGTLLAERISVVILDFELIEDHFLLNSVPVKLGVKDIQIIKARVVPANIKEEDIYKYDENFDIGLVKVEISASVEPLRKIIISIKVIEIDGVEISSTNVIENTWEFELSETVDEDQNSEVLSVDDGRLSHQPCSSSLRSIPGRLHRWWRCSSRYTRIFISSFFITMAFGVLHFLISVTINAVMSFVSPSDKFKKYQKVLREEESGSYKSMHGEVEKVIFVADDYKPESRAKMT